MQLEITGQQMGHGMPNQALEVRVAQNACLSSNKLSTFAPRRFQEGLLCAAR